jgi:hypothetical protein
MHIRFVTSARVAGIDLKCIIVEPSNLIAQLFILKKI